MTDATSPASSAAVESVSAAPAAWPTQADLGGLDGFGPIAIDEPEGDPFHTAWEPRVLALTLAMAAPGGWNIDISRAAREVLPGYRGLSYYEVWLAALQRLMLDRGLVTAGELADGHAQAAPLPGRPVLRADAVATALARGTAAERPPSQPPRYAVGDAVRMRADAPPHHTRRPRYTWGRVGRIEQVHAMHVLADAQAQGLGEQPQWLYRVAFDARTLWGDAADARDGVCVDAWESYLQPPLEEPLSPPAEARP
ncbi:MAG: nitrile hydratase subunit beta [Aquabacterium sp.]